jgi:hypothetical protein
VGVAEGELEADGDGDGEAADALPDPPTARNAPAATATTSLAWMLTDVRTG